MKMNIETFRSHLRKRLDPSKDAGYAVIRVHKDDIPAGGELVEAYLTADEGIILGQPEDEPEGLTPTEMERWYEQAHNCDFMGCGTLSHVLFRFPRKLA